MQRSPGGATSTPVPNAQSTSGEAAQEQGAVSISRFFATMGPTFLGLCCGNVWIGWMNGARALGPSWLWDMVCSATIVLTLLAGACYGLRHPEVTRARYPLDWPIAILMALTTLPAAGIPVVPDFPLLVAATIGGQIGMGWLFIRWGLFLSTLDLRSTVGAIFFAHVVGCTAKLVLYFVPHVVSAIPISLLPLLSTALVAPAYRRGAAMGLLGPSQGAVWCSPSVRSWGPLWKVAAFVFIYRLIFQCCLLGTAGSRVNISLSTVCCLAEIAVSLLIVYMMFMRSGSFAFHQVWSVFLLLLGFSILCYADDASAVVGSSVMAAAGSLLVMFTWLAFADISHHCDAHPFFVFAVARIAYELPRLVLSSAACLGATIPSLGPFLMALLLFMLLAFSLLFFERRNPTLALVFSDFDKPKVDDADTIGAVCAQAASEYGLTAREEEVLRYLCQGRTRAYIAETLYLSQNTIRGHTQRIYAKLDVHNKTELQRLLGV